MEQCDHGLETEIEVFKDTVVVCPVLAPLQVPCFLPCSATPRDAFRPQKPLRCFGILILPPVPGAGLGAGPTLALLLLPQL